MSEIYEPLLPSLHVAGNLHHGYERHEGEEADIRDQGEGEGTGNIG